MSSTTLHLYKQNFKFSAAHFLIFDAHRAERLHGHNYQVRVDFKFKDDSQIKRQGFHTDFQKLKDVIKQRLDQWDERVLLPHLHPEMKFTKKQASLEVRFRDRFYVFPANEVCLLEVNNTSVEQLSKLLAADLFQELKSHGLSQLRVKVEETRGQAACTTV